MPVHIGRLPGLNGVSTPGRTDGSGRTPVGLLGTGTGRDPGTMPGAAGAGGGGAVEGVRGRNIRAARQPTQFTSALSP